MPMFAPSGVWLLPFALCPSVTGAPTSVAALESDDGSLAERAGIDCDDTFVSGTARDESEAALPVAFDFASLGLVC